MLDLFTLVAIVAACVSCGAAVFSVWFIRRGADAELRSDVENLAISVERLAKNSRRRQMAAVRAAAETKPEPQDTQQPLDYPIHSKEQLRAQLARSVRG